MLKVNTLKADQRPGSCSDAYLEPNQSSTMDFYSKIVNGF